MTVRVFRDESVEAQHALAEWAIKRLPGEELQSVEDLGPFVAFGVVRNNQPVAVVIWNWFRRMSEGADIRVIIAADDPRWCLPGVLRELFSFPFEYLQCTRVTAIIKHGNERSLKLCRGLGFVKEGVLRRGHNGKTNAILLSMLREECKWLMPPEERKRHGQKKRALTANAARSSTDDQRAKRGGQRVLNGVDAPERRKHLRPNGQYDVRQAP